MTTKLADNGGNGYLMTPPARRRKVVGAAVRIAPTLVGFVPA
jgi:hypothetical protein